MQKSTVFRLGSVLICTSFTACASVGREAVENLGGRVASTTARTRPAMNVTKVVAKARGFVATVSTANGVYRIYVDCKTGVMDRNAEQLTQVEKANFVRDVCSGNLR